MLTSAMQAVGKPATLKLYPPYGVTTEDGHAGFCNRAMALWGGDALAFLREAAFRSLRAQQPAQTAGPIQNDGAR